VMTRAVAYSEIAAAATIAIAIESSIVTRRAARFSALFLKIGHPPIATPAAPIRLMLANGSHRWSHTAAALSATTAIRAASAQPGG